MRVLFVEDDPMNRRVVRDMLSVAGVDMEEAESGEAGLERLSIDTFDLILMDLRMPGMDGLTAVRHIRAGSGVNAALPVIVVTADTALDLQQQCLDAGADAVVKKPVAMSALFDTMGAVLAARSPAEAMLA